ncbi:hypothetical protein GQX74_006689 [Glossina fuscipes]|nr:hypothetical protein GQX74_006689 [Glossina fuscipes]
MDIGIKGGGGPGSGGACHSSRNTIFYEKRILW